MNPSKALSKLDGIIARLGKFKPIRANHGSPHSFSRFDASKIGTGEGAQAFGHGLYFAGNEKVASDTRDAVMAMRRPDGEALGRSSWDGTRTFAHPDEADNLTVMQETIRSLQERIAAGRQRTDPFGWSEKPYHEAIQWLSSQDPRLPLPPRPAGHMYEVDIHLPEELLLDWDAPMSAQSQNVIHALRKLDAFPELPSSVPWEPDGSHAYRRLKELRLANSGRAAIKAAKMLADEGIPGIRYLDQGSRSAGEGTRNYVIFPGAEDAITILRKYGFLPPVAAAAAMSGEEQ